MQEEHKKVFYTEYKMLPVVLEARHRRKLTKSRLSQVFFSWQAQILWNTFQKVIFNCFTFFYFLRQLEKLFYQLLPNWFKWVQFFANRLFAVLPLLLLPFEGQFHLDLFQKVFSTFLQSWFHRQQKWCSWYYHFTSLWEVFKWRKRILSFRKVSRRNWWHCPIKIATHCLQTLYCNDTLG